MSGERAGLSGRPGYLAFLPDFLFRTDSLKSRYIVKAWLLALLPAMALSALVVMIAPGGGREPFALTPARILLMVTLVPLVETLLMAGPVLLINRLAGPGPSVVASALLWGALHSTAAPTWGLVAWWPFLILSIAFLAWNERGFTTATLIVTAIHGLQNSVSAALLLIIYASAGNPAAPLPG